MLIVCLGGNEYQSNVLSPAYIYNTQTARRGHY